MKIFRWFTVLILTAYLAALADDLQTSLLPFDRQVINRYSLDHLPRSISIRHSPEVWLGYDLERARVYKVWRSPAGKPGLTASGFRVKSTGQTLFEDNSSDGWVLDHATKPEPLSVRYLGISQFKDAFQLTWELQHHSSKLILTERVSLNVAEAADEVVREVRIQQLLPDHKVRLPASQTATWKLFSGSGVAVNHIADSSWHRLTLNAVPTVPQ